MPSRIPDFAFIPWQIQGAIPIEIGAHRFGYYFPYKNVLTGDYGQKIRIQRDSFLILGWEDGVTREIAYFAENQWQRAPVSDLIPKIKFQKTAEAIILIISFLLTVGGEKEFLFKIFQRSHPR